VGRVRLTGSRTTVDLYKSDGVAVAPRVQSLHDVLQTDVMCIHSIATKDLLWMMPVFENTYKLATKIRK
jgi:hypothetical protein